MKKTMFILPVLLFFYSVTAAQQYTFENLVGSWRNRTGAGFDVIDSNTIYVVNGAKRTLANNSRADFTQKPAWLDLSLQGVKSAVTFKSFLRFVNETTLQWQLIEAETRPANFRYDKGQVFFLKKIEVLSN